MEKQDIIDPEYLEGFNQDYILAKHMPDTAAKIAEAESTSPHIVGFRAGRDQHALEVVREKHPEWLRSGTRYKEPPTPNRDKGRDRDMDRS